MKIYKINEIVDSISETHNFQKEELIPINTSDILEGDFLQYSYQPTNTLKGQFKKTTKKNDILFSEIRPANRRYALVNFLNTEDFVLSTKLMVLRKFNENVDLDYFYYFLTNQKFLDILQRRAENRIGSFPQITFDLLSEYSIAVPETITEQKRIVEIIKTIDSKIEMNKKIKNELENMAKELYDYWFVQFDFPGIDGNPYKSSGKKMAYNELLKRNIPAGWKVAKIGDILDSVPNSKKFKSNEYLEDGCTPIIDQGEKYIAGYTSEDKIIKKYPAVVFGDHSCRVKLVNFPFARGADGTQILYSKIKEISEYYLYFTVLELNLDTGYARHFAYLRDFMPIIIPPEEIGIKYTEITQDLFKEIKTRIFENIELSKLRDELLPMLMNGQVRVK